MSTFYVRLSSIDDAVHLVNCLERYPFGIEACIGQSVISAKSILGIIGIGMNKKIEIRIREEHVSLVENVISNIKCA